MASVETPIILEDCEQITIGPYNLGYPKLKNHFQSAALDPSIPPI